MPKKISKRVKRSKSKSRKNTRKMVNNKVKVYKSKSRKSRKMSGGGIGYGAPILQAK